MVHIASSNSFIIEIVYQTKQKVSQRSVLLSAWRWKKVLHFKIMMLYNVINVLSRIRKDLNVPCIVKPAINITPTSTLEWWLTRNLKATLPALLHVTDFAGVANKATTNSPHPPASSLGLIWVSVVPFLCFSGFSTGLPTSRTARTLAFDKFLELLELVRKN